MPSTLERTYYTDVDYVLDASSATNMVKSIFFAFKASLKKEILSTNSGAVTAWTCEGSSDSVTAGMDASDRWTSSYDATKIVVAASGGAVRSWIVLKNAGLGIWICLHLNSTNIPQAELLVATTAFTGGSTTARPTSTTEIDPGPGNYIVAQPTASASKAHRCFDSNGNFIFLVSRNGQAVHTCIALQAVTDTRTGDPKPWVFINDVGTSDIVAALQAGNSSANTVSPQWRSTLAAAHGRAYSPKDGTTKIVVVPSFWASSTTSVWFGGTMTAADSADSKFDDAPISMVSMTTDLITIKGRLYDWRQTAGPAGGSTYPAATAPNMTHLAVGNCWIPWTVPITL